MMTQPSPAAAGNPPPPVQKLPWDSEHFGFPVGRYVAEWMDEAAAAAAVQHARASGLRCMYFLTGADQTDSIAAAQRHGFRVVDVRLTLEQVGSWPQPVMALTAGAVLRSAETGDRAALDALARESFTDSRFYADPGFPRAKAGELYARWLQRDLELDPDGVIVAQIGREVAGFISTRMGPTAGQISLIAVDEHFRAAGLGGALVAAALERLRGQGAAMVSVVTQARNLGALRMYERAGFRTQRVDLWFHYWLGEGS